MRAKRIKLDLVQRQYNTIHVIDEEKYIAVSYGGVFVSITR